MTDTPKFLERVDQHLTDEDVTLQELAESTGQEVEDLDPEARVALRHLAEEARLETERSRLANMKMMQSRPFRAVSVEVRPTKWGPRWFIEFNADDGLRGTLPVASGQPARDAFLKQLAALTAAGERPHLVLDAIPLHKGPGRPLYVFRLLDA